MTSYTPAIQPSIEIKIFNILFFLIIMPFFFYPEAYASNATVSQKNGPKKIIIAPVKNETREKQFNNLLVMNGIKSLVAQALFDTGMFMPLEKNPEAIKNIEEFIGRNVTETNDSNETADYMTIRPTIKKLKKSRSRFMFGGLSGATTKIQIEISLEIQDVDRSITIVYGKGKASMKSHGILFSIKDDKINFDETGVGRALKLAVEDAVRHYVTKISNQTERTNVYKNQ